MKAPRLGRAPGRPRDPAADKAILDTTVRLLIEQGYDAMSVESVANAAGVGKTTIYRRYPGKREVVVAAIASIADALEPPMDSGDTRRDLEAFVRQWLGVVRRDGLGFAMIGTLLSKERTEPALLEQFRDAVILPRMEVGAAIVRRGIATGQIRADVAPDAVIQLIAGSFFARHLSGRADDDAWIGTVLDLLWQGIATGA